MQPLQDGDPQRIGRYEVLARIGEGGMGRVFLGQSDSGRRVALKVVHADLARSPGFRERFAREIAAARTVGGFWTAAVVDADADAELPWLATEYIPGPSLEQHVREAGPLPAAGLRALAVGLCEAVAAIHRAGLVHRDLKPTNILLLPDGPRVIDFGISRALDQAALTTMRHIMGTPGFMAPEQVRHGQVSAASDVFGIGLILVFAATGRPLYEGDLVHFAYQVVHGEPDLREIPDDLRPVVARCLIKEPAERPTALEVLDSLARTGTGTGTGTGATPVLPAGWGSPDLATQIAQGAERPPWLTPASGTVTPDPEPPRVTEHLHVGSPLPSVAEEPKATVPQRRLSGRGKAVTVGAAALLVVAGIAWQESRQSISVPSAATGSDQPTTSTSAKKLSQPVTSSRQAKSLPVATSSPAAAASRSSDPGATDGPTDVPSNVDPATEARACSLLTVDQVRQLTGIAVGQTQSESFTVGDGSCAWMPTDSVADVIVDLMVGDPGDGALQCAPNDGSSTPLDIHGSTLPAACLNAGASIYISNGHDSAAVTVFKDGVNEDAAAGLAVAEAIKSKI